MNKYKYSFQVTPADESLETLKYVNYKGKL
jgi:hypothetical protein